MLLFILALKISGIGVLPIVLVLASVVFLWGMVVVNSLKARRARTDGYLQAVGRAAFQRVQLLTRLGELLQTPLITDPDGYDEPRLAAETARIQTLVANLNPAGNPDASRLQADLAANAATLVQAQRRFRSSRAAYNELCSQAPYKLVAGLFGFKALAA